jgi:hypothetical protein
MDDHVNRFGSNSIAQNYHNFLLPRLFVAEQPS